MSIVIAVINQPLCCVTVDSCQTKIFDPGDPSRNQYFLDVNKIHAFNNFLIAECGNPHGFRKYWHAASGMRIDTLGIEFFMDRSQEIIDIVGAQWRRIYQRRWPSMTPDQIRVFSRTIAVIAGYSHRLGMMLARAVSDDPIMRAEVQGNGFYIAGGSDKTTHDARDFLMNLLTGRRNMLATREGILRASIMAAQRAGKTERRHTGAPTIGGRIAQMVINGPEPPLVVTNPVAYI